MAASLPNDPSQTEVQSVTISLKDEQIFFTWLFVCLNTIWEKFISTVMENSPAII